MNSDTPDGVADALRIYLDTIDQVIADSVTDDDIEARLYKLTQQERPSTSRGVDASTTVPLPKEDPHRVTPVE